MKRRLILLFCFFQAVATAQTFNPFYSALTANCNQDSVTQNLMEFEALGIKELGTSALDDTYDWLVSKYTNLGYTDIVADDFFANGWPTKNLIVTKTGTVFPDTYVIIDGHYDTKNGTGTNDNGTGTAIILEAARLLKNINTEYSIKFIHFSAEETSLQGSQHYVNTDVVPNNMDIKIVFNIDQVGGVNGMTNNTIICEQDMSPPSSNDAQSALMTNELATCIELYSNLMTEISYAYGSDYVPFMNQGEIITGLYEKNQTPYAHTIQDSIEYIDLDYVYEITKGSLGALSHFAIAYEELAIPENESNDLNVFPIPSDGYLTLSIESLVGQPIDLTISNISGAISHKTRISSLNVEQIVDIMHLGPGAYLLYIEAQNQRYYKQIFLK